MSIDFSITDVPNDLSNLPPDTIPELAEVEYPCKKCGREAGPYKGRGRKPTMCVDCKPGRANQGAPRVSGSTANLAAQATEVLSQLNAMIAIAASAFQMFGTAGAIAGADDRFRAQAYAALTTDPELCRFILKGGVKSAKITLLLAYGSMGISVAPVAVAEFKESMARRKAEKESEEQG